MYAIVHTMATIQKSHISNFTSFSPHHLPRHEVGEKFPWQKKASDDHAAAADPPAEETESDDHDEALIQVKSLVFMQGTYLYRKTG